MLVISIDPKTGKEVTTNVPDPSPSFFSFVDSFELNDEQIRSRIDQMNVSADVKALLYSFSKATIRAGKAIVKIGRKIVDVLFSIMRAFPNVTFGLIFGWVVGALIAGIPIFGAVLGPLATPLAMAFGAALGAKADMENGDLGKRVEAVLTEFSPLYA